MQEIYGEVVQKVTNGMRFSYETYDRYEYTLDIDNLGNVTYA